MSTDKQTLDELIPATEFFICPFCDEKHEDEYEARNCCPISSRKYYLCPVCEQAHDSQLEAFRCHSENMEQLDDSDDAAAKLLYQERMALAEAEGQVRLFA